MSLKIWLPLDGDLRNLGTSPDTFSGSPTYTQGKIGQCMVCPATVLTTESNLPTQLTKNNVYSLCCWAKMANPSEGSGWLIILGGGTGTTRGLWISSTVQWAYSGSGQNFQVSIHPNDGNWHHIAATIDGSTAKLYIDGQYMSSITPTSLGQVFGKTIQIGTPSRSFHINDIRIYDHCLSAAEVHEIAQGLVLHYKLEGPMGGSGINLLQGSNKIGGSNNYGWIQNGSYTNFSIEKLEGNIIHYKGTISNNKYIPSITTNTAAPCEFGKTYTYQMELKFDKDVKLASNIPMHYWAGCRNTDDITNVSCDGNLTGITYSYVQNHSGTLTANTWVKIITQITFPSAATTTGYDYPAIRPFVYGAVLSEAYTGEVNVWMRNCKIEEGTIATNWSIAPEDIGIDTTIVEDNSGYGHNGEIINNITLLADSPRYSKSIHFSAKNQKIKISNFPTSGFGDSYTFAWWGKTASTVYMQWGFKDGIRLNGMYQGKLWNTGDSLNNPLYIPGTTTQVTAPTTGVWHHYVMTGDGNTCKVYLDGAFWGQAKTYKSISGTTIYINGWDETTTYASSNFSISDFRIYCTPLLDNDVKLLYNTSMRIDKLNQFHTFEFLESDNEQLTKKGVLITNGLEEQNNTIVKLKKEKGWIASNFIEM